MVSLRLFQAVTAHARAFSVCAKHIAQALIGARVQKTLQIFAVPISPFALLCCRLLHF